MLLAQSDHGSLDFVVSGQRVPLVRGREQLLRSLTSVRRRQELDRVIPVDRHLQRLLTLGDSARLEAEVVVPLERRREVPVVTDRARPGPLEVGT